MRSKPLLLMGLTLTGCFDYATLQTNECFHGTCKDGLICVGGFCELPLNRDLSGQPDPADGSTQSGPDLRTRWDPAAVPVATPACTSGLGRPLNPTMVACAGVTLRAVATAMGVTIRTGKITAEGIWDARGTLAIDRNTPVGLTEVTLKFDVDCDADAAKLERMIQTTERYCVILQTLKTPPKLSVAIGA